MREVIKWNKNHITGKYIEKKVYKDSDALIGRANIKIFDANGNLKDETQSENLIPSWISEAEWYRDLYLSVQSGELTSSISGAPTAFGNLLLTTCEDDEDETNPTIRGNLIGWCPRTDTNPGSDVKRGIYNPIESLITIEDDRYYHAHLVYDFGTSQANGTFSSVFWGKTAYTNTTPLVPFYLCRLNFLHAKTTLDIGIRKNRLGEYVKQVGDKWFKVLNLEAHLNRLEVVKLSDVETRGPMNSGLILEDNDSYVTYTNRVSSYNDSSLELLVKKYSDSSEINRIKIDCKELTPDIFKYTTNSSKDYVNTTIYSVYENGDTVIQFYASSYYNNIPGIDSTGASTGKKGSIIWYGVINAFTGQWIVIPDFTKVTSVYEVDSQRFPDSEYYNIFGRKYYLQAGTHNRIQEIYRKAYKDKYLKTYAGFELSRAISNNDNSNSSERNYRMLCYFEEYQVMMDNQGYLYKLLPYSAHTKLPNPVVKTAADTMKVQYDYYIQIPHLLSLENDFITPPGSKKEE